MKNKSLVLLLLSILIVLCSCKAEPKEFTVFSGGETDYSIVTAAGGAGEAQDLANRLSALSGAEPELYSDALSEKRKEILVGETNREATAKYIKKLQENATVLAFHFVIAEDNGKVVILADHEAGYDYAYDYLAESYITDGKFVITEGTCDLKTVTFDEYYMSAYYEKHLAEAEDKNRFEEEKQQFENEMNRYDDNKGDTIMTVEQAIEQYKKQAAAFTTADFGEYSPTSFTSANTYRAPKVYPGEAHPRILFTPNSIDSLRANLGADENKTAYNRYISLSDSPCDGKFKSVTGSMTHNMDYGITANIEAKAFRYAMTGEKIYGYQAIIAIKNAMLTIDVPHTVGDWCRAYGMILYVAGCVYDWCYDLLTEEDKAQLIHGCVNLLGMHLEIVCYGGASNKAPTQQGTMCGHGCEGQLLVEYLSFAIACFDEAPEIYELVAGRVTNDYAEAQNFLYQSGSHWEGAFYGAYRTTFTLQSNILFDKMTDGKYRPFSDDLNRVVTTLTHYVRPDGQNLRIGDMNENMTASEYSPSRTINAAYYAAALYKNPELKEFAYKGLRSFNSFSNGGAGLSVVQLLATNDPTVPHVSDKPKALTNTTTWPLTNLFARSAHDNVNAFMVYMTMPENYFMSHGHAECGSFQIYYKGILASDSGKYATWASLHHMGYNMQTVSSNSLLIYNPNMEDVKNTYRINALYTGGQSVKTERSNYPDTFDGMESYIGLGQCTSLGVANVEKNGQYLYSYMGGDMTKAYDEETVDEVTRYMFAVATGNTDCPLVFLTFDRITSDDASYKKSALIHTQEEPTITNDGFAIVTNTKNGNSGKMIVQTVGFDTEYTLIGGEGKQFWLSDKLGNADTDTNLVAGSIAEYGWGRIHISPAEAEKTNHMLTVMYVTDASNNSSLKKAEDLCSENLAGASLFGKSVLFPKNEKLLTKESSFTVNTAGECFVAGVSAGSWTVTKDGKTVATVTVADGTNLLSFTAEAGNYVITPAN